MPMSRVKQSNALNSVVCEVLPLEPRLFLSASVGHAHEIEALPPMAATVSLAKLKKASAAKSANAQAGSIPLLHSNPLAPVTIHLDFDGDTTAAWLGMKPGTTPAYDRDGDAGSFSSSEIAAIRSIWTRVAEYYSPFDVDVTTEKAGTLADKRSVRIVIGGAGKWLGERAGGVGGVGAFYEGGIPNTAFVFPDNLHNGDPRAAAMAAAHEAGHAFGLKHQSVWNGNRLAEDYNPGTDKAAPIMGGNYAAERTLWWRGISKAGPDVIQDDLDVLTDPANGLSWRADDVGDTFADAAPIAVSSRSIRGVISTLQDADAFSFTVGKTGYIDVSVATPAGGMLAYGVDLLNAAGELVKSFAGAAEMRMITTKLAAGAYFVRIRSRGGMGDLGQYALTVAQGNPPPPTPTGVRATGKSDTEMTIQWDDRSQHERGFMIQRSVDGKAWTPLVRVNAGQTSFRDRNLTPETSYFYRVIAYNTAGFSRFSTPDEGRTMRTPVTLQ